MDRRRNAQNSAQGLETLPNETLCDILELACEDTCFDVNAQVLNTRLKQAVRLSHVSCHLRNVAITNGELWNRIYIQMHHRALPACLARAGSTIIHVHAENKHFNLKHRPNRSQYEQMLQKFLATIGSDRIERLGSLYFVAKSPEMMRHLLDTVQSRQSLPLLTHLRIAYGSAARIKLPMDLSQLNWNAPALQVVQCTNVVPSPNCGSTHTRIAIAFNSHLRFSHAFVHMPLETMQRCTSLELQYCYDTLITENGQVMSPLHHDTVLLPRLKSLVTYLGRVDDPRSPRHCDTFSRLRMPHLNSLEIELHEHTPVLWAAFLAALTALPELQQLSFGAYDVELPALLRKQVLPALAELTISRAHITCADRTPTSWPDFPPLRKLRFAYCHGGALRHYAIPAIFKTLSLSRSAWDGFQVMNVRNCFGDFHCPTFQVFLDGYVGRPVAHKFKGLNTFPILREAELDVDESDSEGGATGVAMSMDLDHLTQSEEDEWDGESDSDWDLGWDSEEFSNAEQDEMEPYLMMD